MANAQKLNLHQVPSYQRLGSYSLPRMARMWSTSGVIWGAGAGIAVLYLLSVTPIVKNRLLVKVPVLGRYYEDDTPASDKPF
ncbi:hypothetical protein OE88DRAFT_1653915 [Heliocybe sulcata]|uniref:Uncharacterized protein n=1 Tax=Heliocybe sulcata TaxID=5364 RepID=A0A5C3NBY4_9AGAM|nr:hypothetical protein OE88DRAFT_1653915 [Heliocybe sulcata]